ncbi:TPA_asm: hypothetical protein HUJ06_031911 [Nelumbo nucifera]|uniref:Cytochrome b/b6 N-terminal region profile domain-containing protein n=1 Tax=Nelumbo nucifera TaxID=4432 RepID=A0A823A0Y3_NELNU|nr:TPA_asm: hypothetical protein HUJ06_031911 [Nelumbo nucifera]
MSRLDILALSSQRGASGFLFLRIFGENGIMGLKINMFLHMSTYFIAFASVQYIMTEANFGWLIRSVHRWSASMMVLMMILHVFRVYLTGGFKKPRELTWVTGVILAVLTASFGVTGYSLPWDQIGYWAVKIVTGVPEAIPVIGSPLVELLRGSASVGHPL